MALKRPVAVVCAKCGQRGDKPPGFKRRSFPEAVGVGDSEMVPVWSFECRNCGTGFVIPRGTVEIRKEREA